MTIRLLPVLLVLALAGAVPAQDSKDGWTPLFNGKDLTGWKLRSDKLTVTKFVDLDGNVIEGAKKAKLDQKELAQDVKGKAIDGAKIVVTDKKQIVVDADGNPIAGAKVGKVGGREAIVNKAGEELKDAKAVQETVPNPMGWTVEKGGLICDKPHSGNDLLTEQKFTDFELSIEFLATSNSGVYLQGRYEIQVDNSYGAKPKLVEKDGKKIEMLDTHQCGAIYGLIAPSKNMAKKPTEWQSYEVLFQALAARAARSRKRRGSR